MPLRRRCGRSRPIPSGPTSRVTRNTPGRRSTACAISRSTGSSTWRRTSWRSGSASTRCTC
ncbi:MAG: hypothetical protein EPN40_11970 [Rhodanobacteraceae bacterium]|nr:MAG: hypothetical protein EPN40_11970 [Rhodanobacteraceae bacterium]